MNIVRPFCWTISDQILAASPSLFPWKPVWLMASSSSDTLFGVTSIALSGVSRYFFAFLSLTALPASFCTTTPLSNRPGFKSLLDRHRLGEVPRMVRVVLLLCRHEVGEELEWDDLEHRCDAPVRGGDSHRVREDGMGLLRHSYYFGAPRGELLGVGYCVVVSVAVRRYDDDGRSLLYQGEGPVLQLSRRHTLCVYVG